ncbi:MAG TPA: ferric reductase-like transmembrane domain-containing protein [Pseudonocardiaceae bacterium]|nr:ferric reductase-like transmembrane domain-containing protein [Pseudonocardiaceae bacterium]
MNQETLWSVSRGTGLVALLLFTAAVILGALNGSRAASPRWPRFVISALHRNVSLLALAFLVIHIATAVIDPYAGIRWLDALVPFGSAYRGRWLGLGAIATDLVLAVVVTSLLRPRINARLWRVVHWCSYLSWPVAVLHGLGTAPDDTRIGWILGFNIACVLLVLIVVGWRMRVIHPDTAVRQAARAARQWGRP